MANLTSNPKSESQEFTYDKALSEINNITGKLTLKNLYSLLGCARGLIKSQKLTKN
jgi:hypothetical protein